MNATQAIIILKNGARKYGFILDHADTGKIQFIAGTENIWKEGADAVSLVEHIPLDHIVSIDTFLK